MNARHSCRSVPAAETPTSEFRVTLTVSINDVAALWTAAAAKVIATVPGATFDDVVEMAGPSEDPSIEDCLAILTSPTAISGCALDEFKIEKSSSVQPTATLSDLVPARPSRSQSGVGQRWTAVNDQRDGHLSVN